MNSWTDNDPLDDVADDPAQARDGADTQDPASPAGEGDNDIFRGDTGELPLEVRRVLVQLLLGPSVDSHRQTKLWPVLVRHERVLRSRLHEMFLELVIDFDQQVAFTRQVVSDTTDLPVLLRKASLTFLETALLLYLRLRLTQADAQGERAVVSTEEMLEHLAVYERAANQDRSRYGRQMEIAIEKAKKLSLLRLVHGTKNRFEVAPTLKLLFSAEEIQQLMRHYDAMAGEGGEGRRSAGTWPDDGPPPEHLLRDEGADDDPAGPVDEEGAP
jgi:hypothetical protein